MRTRSAAASRPPEHDPEIAPLILVVDDFDDNRGLYATSLRESGFRVEEATNGREALEKIAQAHPALVIMDLSMPVLDGWEATTRIKSDEKTAHITVVAVTSHATEKGLRAATDAGADDVVTRPCLPEDLLMRVRALLTPRPAAAVPRRPVVLLVDEDDDSRRLFTFVLLRFGFEVVATTSGADAVVALGLQRADVLVVHESADGAAS